MAKGAGLAVRGRRSSCCTGAVVAFSSGLSWVFTTLGLVLRTPSAVLNAGFMGPFPLTFLSNVFVMPDTLPGPLEAFVRVNPISILATAPEGSWPETPTQATSPSCPP